MLFNKLLANIQSEYTAFYAFLLHVYSRFGKVSCRLFKSRLYPPGRLPLIAKPGGFARRFQVYEGVGISLVQVKSHKGAKGV